MTDIDYGELFEIEAGANETEVAEPSEIEKDAGEKEQGVAEPAEGETPEAEETAPSQEDNGEALEEEERARFAAARRKAEKERDAAIAKAKEEAQKQLDEAFAMSGITNPYTGERVKSKKEFDEYRERYEADRKKALLKKSGMSDEEFESFIGSLPQVRAANIAKAQADAALRKAQEAEMESVVAAQINEIGQIDPSIKSIADFQKMDNYEEFYGFVQKGLSFVEAYKLANFDKLTQQTAQKARRAAMNAAQGKEHLSATAQRGAGTVTVPTEIKAQYRMFNPEATDAEIEKHYNNYLKQQKG